MKPAQFFHLALTSTSKKILHLCTQSLGTGSPIGRTNRTALGLPGSASPQICSHSLTDCMAIRSLGSEISREWYLSKP